VSGETAVRTKVLDVDHEKQENGTVVRVFGSDDEGNRVKAIDRRPRPYFIAVPEEDEDVQEVCEDIRGTEYTCDSEQITPTAVSVVRKEHEGQKRECLRLEVDFTAQVTKLRREIQALEQISDTRNHDVNLYKKWMINNDIYPVSQVVITGEEQETESGTDHRLIEINSIDAEADTRKETHRHMSFDIEVHENEVIMISVFSESLRKVLSTKDIDREFVEKCNGEEDLLRRFIGLFKDHDPDVLTGYNSDEYDFHVLRERVEHHGLTLSLGVSGERMKFNRRGRFSSARVKGICHLDMYPYVQHVMSPGLDTNTLDLDSVVGELLGMSKNDLNWEEMKQYWSQDKNLEEFADYALKDAEVTYKLGEKIYPQIFELSRITGLIPFDACRLTYGQLVENYLIRECMSRNRLVPRRPFRSEQEERRRKSDVEGGFVYQPDPGIYTDVAVLDFKSLYPTVMVSHNISPDTLNVEDCDNKESIDDLDLFFCKDRQGFFPELIEGLVSDRSAVKNRMSDLEEGSAKYQNLYNRQQAQKILANAFYGYLAYTGARWYSEECASATTYLGRQYIQDSIEEAEDQGFSIIYGDTDSVMLQKKGLKQEISDYLESVNSTLPEFMELENEGYFESAFFTSTGEKGRGAKKKYALMDESGGLKITGFEQVRRDWAPVAKRCQKKVLKKVLAGSPEDAADYVKNVVNKIRDGEYPVQELKIHSTLTKPPEEYDSTSPHVEAVKKAKEKGDSIEPETTISYVICPGGGTISDRARLLKYSEEYDPEYYIENQIVPAAHRVLKVFDYTEEQLRGEGKQTGLGKFQ
jgi:DNA polymerase elongation subunit (family B)